MTQPTSTAPDLDSTVRGLVLVLDLLAFRHDESRSSCNNFVRSASRWEIQLLEDDQEHEHDFSISDFRFRTRRSSSLAGIKEQARSWQTSSTHEIS
jgi:hypothetical protein